MKITASIIIPVRNNLEFTRNCLKSIRDTAEGIDYEIIVIDNASDDGSSDMLKDEADNGKLKHIYNEQPRHFAASCNQGAETACGDYLVFLNNDIVAKDGWLREMMVVAEKSPDVGAVGAKLLYPDGTIQHAGVAFHYFESLGQFRPYHLFRTFPADSETVNKVREFQAVTGACMLTPASVFQEIGGFDEGYVNCFEDIDYCLHLGAKGLKIIYAPQAELIHYEGQTKGRNDNVDHSCSLLMSKWSGKVYCDDYDIVQGEGYLLRVTDDFNLCIHPGDEIRDWHQAILQLVELKQFRMALDEIDKIGRVIGGSKVSLHKLKGKCHLELGESEEAKLAFARAMAVDPEDTEARWGLEQVGLKEEDRGVALKSGLSF
ncbi:hypothetical protein CEE37_01520 [candidate division LCP-89 bacterium B3_LCP]|uniref:Glycosyltransferase 2-like domain-containing protein n=1 Tax=candidate division LCP-89 bacterium B3_LCP TaxID=2012998 RepID=A0A532V603_UNCL8|nr:MAG: hypothetical protein CEE37_01520 [candidate division LCP-89 bacterium B3_LCP]